MESVVGRSMAEMDSAKAFWLGQSNGTAVLLPGGLSPARSPQNLALLLAGLAPGHVEKGR